MITLELTPVPSAAVTIPESTDARVVPECADDALRAGGPLQRLEACFLRVSARMPGPSGALRSAPLRSAAAAAALQGGRELKLLGADAPGLPEDGEFDGPHLVTPQQGLQQGHVSGHPEGSESGLLSQRKPHDRGAVARLERAP